MQDRSYRSVVIYIIQLFVLQTDDRQPFEPLCSDRSAPGSRLLDHKKYSRTQISWLKMVQC
jgi:hypothetical protein